LIYGNNIAFNAPAQPFPAIYPILLFAEKKNGNMFSAAVCFECHANFIDHRQACSRLNDIGLFHKLPQPA
jgi:hypothetical protein